MYFPAFLASFGLLVGPVLGSWERHTIDNSSKGADGVRVADVNGDGLLDLTTGCRLNHLRH